MPEKKRVEFYRRLPEIYRIKDEDLPKLYLENGQPVAAFQLKKYLEPVEEMFSAIHENIESLYHDFFIEYCDPWVIPYIADLLGSSHLSGEEWTLRADVADTIALRRRKGTLGAVELLAYIHTRWGVHSVELLENMVWNQHLNHQRPEEGGKPPYSLPSVRPAGPIRGGTVNLRDPSLLAKLGTPFDQFAHIADVKPPVTDRVSYNLPNLAIYLWRQKDYRLQATKPHAEKVTTAAGAFVVRVNVDSIPCNMVPESYVKPGNEPAGRPVTLFNTNRITLNNRARKGADALNPAATMPRISSTDQVPGPIPRERISDYEIADDYDKSLESAVPKPLRYFTDASFTAPQDYLAVGSYDPEFDATKPEGDLKSLDISAVGLQLHLPEPKFKDEIWPHKKKGRYWKIRGENLCAWEQALRSPLKNREIAIDPAIGRICIGVSDDTEADSLVNDLLITYSYGAVGPVGAHPISHSPLPKEFNFKETPAVYFREVMFSDPGKQLQTVLEKALEDARVAAADGKPLKAIVIEIRDSRTHPLDIGSFNASDINDETGKSVLLTCPLIIRAGDYDRPVIKLARPFSFRPAKVTGTDDKEQKIIDVRTRELFVRFEGLYIARSFGYDAGKPLVARAALNRLEIMNCTLDPGGFRYFNGKRAPLLPGIGLEETYGFETDADKRAFKQVPEIVIQRSICGAVFADEGYTLCLSDSIIESIPVPAGSETFYAIAGATNTPAGYGGATTIRNVTVLGRVRTTTIEGAGGIFTGVVEVFDRQAGCLKHCYFAEDSDGLPQHFACVFSDEARLLFTSEFFSDPGYCQLSLQCDRRILEEGVDMDQMGAFNFLQEAHKWRNLRIRFREFMPVGIRPLLIPVT